MARFLGMLLGGLPMFIGNLKSLCLLWTNLASNHRYHPFVEEADKATFTSRVGNEGLTFLTVVLPRIGKALDSYHSTLEWKPPSNFEVRLLSPGFRIDQLGENSIDIVPIFLGKAVEAALNGNSAAVDCVRQLSYLFYKLEVDYDEETVEEFLSQFVKTDERVALFDNNRPPFGEVVIERMRYIIARILCNADPTTIKPRHGAGATACRTPNWEKYHSFKYYKKLDDLFSYSEYFFASPTHLSDELDKLESAPIIDIPRARVCLVPKDSRGPRVISCEPAEMMYIQQGLMTLLYDTLENHHLTSGQINFTDQSINRDLARSGSITGELATIDLSEASDRVSLDLVKRVFPPNWVEALEACRSEETVLPNGKVVKLAKFSPMGSSCCFPVEALIFWAASVSAVDHPNTWLKKHKQLPDIHVYGDDIIVPSNLYQETIRALESVGLEVNANKSYYKGPFRESCGGDYHLGNDVTPVRVRKDLCKSRTSLATNADLINILVDKFGYEDSISLISVIEEAGGYIYPRSELLLPAAIRFSPCASNDVFFRRRFNKNLQRWEHRTLALTSLSNERQPANWSELLRWELSRDRSTKVDRYGRPVMDDHDLNLSSQLTARDYGNWASKLDSSLAPGWYTDTHSVVTKWVWQWLG
jgi:hypothetical protein